MENNELHNLPHNMAKKVFDLRACITHWENFQRYNAPDFDTDPFINSLLAQMRTELDDLVKRLETILQEE